jgi:hypothetical protein
MINKIVSMQNDHHGAIAIDDVFKLAEGLIPSRDFTFKRNLAQTDVAWIIIAKTADLPRPLPRRGVPGGIGFA